MLCELMGKTEMSTRSYRTRWQWGDGLGGPGAAGVLTALLRADLCTPSLGDSTVFRRPAGEAGRDGGRG